MRPRQRPTPGERRCPAPLVAYAVKANPDPALLRRLADEGFGFEVVGPIELALALRAGCAPERIVVNGVGQTDADLADALATGALVNAESLGALEALLRAPSPAASASASTPHWMPGRIRIWPPDRPMRSSGSPSTSCPPRSTGWGGRRNRSAHTSAPPSPMPSRTGSWRPSSPDWRMRREPNGSTWAAASPASRRRWHRPFARTCRTRPG